jgi:hypothetical protein
MVEVWIEKRKARVYRGEEDQKRRTLRVVGATEQRSDANEYLNPLHCFLLSSFLLLLFLPLSPSLFFFLPPSFSVFSFLFSIYKDKKIMPWNQS